MTPQRVIVWLFLIWETSFEKNIYFASSSKRYIGFDQQKSGYVRYTKWQWDLSLATKNATMYCHYETMNDGTLHHPENLYHENLESKPWAY